MLLLLLLLLWVVCSTEAEGCDDTNEPDEGARELTLLLSTLVYWEDENCSVRHSFVYKLLIMLKKVELYLQCGSWSPVLRLRNDCWRGCRTAA